MMSVTIREAVPEDRETLLAIWLRSVRATHTFLSEDDIQSLLPIVRDVALVALEVWVVCVDGGDDASAGEAGESTIAGFLGMDGAEMEALFLDPAYRRRGLGRRMVEHARRLKGPLTVDVNEQNPGAVRFYEACGFEVIGRSKVDGDGRPFPLLHMREVIA
jgi:putative acetyltransferase